MFAARTSLRRNVLVMATLVVIAAAAAMFADGAAAQADKKDKPLPPEDVTLRTSDGVTIAATYYPSQAGKDAAAVILLHAYRGKRSDLEALALKLQRAGSAVIAPDVRGHGDSTGPVGEPRLEDYDAMVRRDLEAVKGFLLQKNNAGELNIERLGVVGVEMGATTAINWAALDWSWPVLATGKQGQDVKALALISPEWGFKGNRISEAMAEPSVRSELSMLIVAGRRNARLLQEARRMYNALDRFHASADAIENQTLFLKTPNTSLQGTQLLNEKTLDVDQAIVEFVELRLLKPVMAWRERKGPLQ